jgi:hypothetical protein
MYVPRLRFKPMASQVINISDIHLTMAFDNYKRNYHPNYCMKYVQMYY